MEAKLTAKFKVQINDIKTEDYALIGKILLAYAAESDSLTERAVVWTQLVPKFSSLIVPTKLSLSLAEGIALMHAVLWYCDSADTPTAVFYNAVFIEIYGKIDYLLTNN